MLGMKSRQSSPAARGGHAVVLEPAIRCDRCSTCRAGHLELCPSGSFAGFGDGRRAPHVYDLAAPPAAPDPPNVDDDAALLEALAVAVHAGPPRGCSIHVARRGDRLRSRSGCGRQGAARPGNHGDHRHRATRASRRGRGGWRRGRRTPRGGERSPIDAVIECAGPDEAVALAVDLVRPGGRVVIVGIPASDQTSVPASAARRKGIAMQWCRRTRRSDFAEAIDLLPRQVEVGSLIEPSLQPRRRDGCLPGSRRSAWPQGHRPARASASDGSARHRRRSRTSWDDRPVRARHACLDATRVGRDRQ